jgi:plastocyanin
MEPTNPQSSIAPEQQPITPPLNTKPSFIQKFKARHHHSGDHVLTAAIIGVVIIAVAISLMAATGQFSSEVPKASPAVVSSLNTSLKTEETKPVVPEPPATTTPAVTSPSSPASVTATKPATIAPAPAVAPTPAPASTPAPTPQPQTYTVTYTNSGFSPASITIKKGDTVIFKNSSSSSFWPASNSHPEHTIYPEFDPKVAIAAGGQWNFTFQKVGTWGYHNHNNANKIGTVIVQ